MDEEPKKRLTPIKAIRAKCLDCSCESYKEVKECSIPECPLYPYRLGKNPYIKRRKGGGNPNLAEQSRKYWADKKAKGKANAKKNWKMDKK